MRGGSYSSAEHDRRIANLVQFGTIAAVDLSAATVTVQIDDDWTTAPLPWAELRAGVSLRTWQAPDVGEQVLVISPSGEPAAGVVLRGIGCAAAPAPSSSQTLSVLAQWSDGALDTYDLAAHVRTLVAPAGGQVVVKVGASTSAVMTDGSITLNAGGVELVLQGGVATLVAGTLNLGAAGGQPVARVGDKVDLSKGVILTGSSTVASA